MNKELPKGVCDSCWGKKYNSVMNRETGSGDFPGDKNYDSGSHIDNIPCSKCNGTGKFPVLEEEKKEYPISKDYRGSRPQEPTEECKCECHNQNLIARIEEHYVSCEQEPMEWESEMRNSLLNEWGADNRASDAFDNWIIKKISSQIKQAEERGYKEGYDNGVHSPIFLTYDDGIKFEKQRILKGIEKLYQDEYPVDCIDGETPVETYGYEETHNGALKQVITLINQNNE